MELDGECLYHRTTISGIEYIMTIEPVLEIHLKDGQDRFSATDIYLPHTLDIFILPLSIIMCLPR